MEEEVGEEAAYTEMSVTQPLLLTDLDAGWYTVRYQISKNCIRFINATYSKR